MQRIPLPLLAIAARRLLLPPRVAKLANLGLYQATMPMIRTGLLRRLLFRPLNTVIAVTSRCNKNCAFCYFRAELNRDDSLSDEMDIERFRALLRHPLVRRASRLVLTGGEPLLNQDVLRMVREARACGHVVSLITNGRLLRTRLAEMEANPPDILTVSYYPEDRDRLRADLPLLTGKMPVKLNFMLSTRRMAELGNALQLARDVAVRLVDIENMTATSPPLEGDEPVFDDDVEYRRLKARLAAAFGRDVAINWRRTLPRQPGIARPGCHVFWHSLHLDARGRVCPCCQWPMHTYTASIFDTPDAWTDARMTALRDDMRAGRIPAYCQGCSALYEDYMGL